MAILLVVHFQKVENAGFWLAYHLTVILFLVSVHGKRVELFKPWLSIVFLMVNFTELHYLVHTVHPHDYDSWLVRADYRLLGLHPTLWLERYTYPLLTEILQWIYASFYFLPILLAWRLWKKKETDRFAYFVMQIVLGFYLSYLGYFLVPAVGPRFTLGDIQTLPLDGVWLRQSIDRLLSAMEQQQRDAFPSGHTMITLLTIYYARLYDRKYFAFVTVLGGLLIFSTVYLRYHYLVDVFAGALWAAVSGWIGMRLFSYIYHPVRVDTKYKIQNKKY